MTENVDIPVTVFIRPHGEQRDATISRPKEIGEIADRIIKAGGRITVEELGGLGTSYAVEFLKDDEIQDIAIEVGFDSNPPMVHHYTAFDKCIRSADKTIQELLLKDPT